MKKKFRKYSPEERTEIIAKVRAMKKAGTHSFDGACKELGVSRGSYDNWIHGRVGKKTKRSYTPRQAPIIKQINLNEIPLTPLDPGGKVTAMVIRGSVDEVRATLANLFS